MTNPISISRIAESIKSFTWSNYGMDDVEIALEEEPEYQDWVSDLAAHILHGFIGDEE